MDIEEGHSPVRIRVFAQDAEPGGGPVHGLARLDLESTEAGVSLASRQSWRRATSAVVDLGSLAAAGILRDLVGVTP